MQKKTIHGVATLVAAALAGTLVACGQPSEAELIAAARSSLDKHEPEAAQAPLKNLLQKQPNSGQARYLLGLALYDAGNPSAALIELSKAHDAKYGDDFVVPAQAKSMLALGQIGRVTQLYAATKLTDPKAAAALKATVSRAFFMEDRLDASQAQMDEALKLDPKNMDALLQQVRFAARRGDFEQALKLVEPVVTENPNRVEPLLLKGELLWGGRQNADAAIATYRSAVKLDPRQMGAYVALLELLKAKGDVAGFKAELADLRKIAPTSIQARYYGAVFALVSGDMVKAKELGEQLLRDAPKETRVLQLVGTIEAQSGSLAQAQVHLTQALQAQPESVDTRQTLAQVQLQSGQVSKVIETLGPLLAGEKSNVDALDLAAQAYMQDGQFDKAVSYFEQAAKLDPNDLRAHVALALAKINRGDAPHGLAELEALAVQDKGVRTDMALIEVLWQRGDIDGALKAVDRMQSKSPQLAFTQLLRGRLLFARHDPAGARAAFEKALSLDSAYYPAITELAALDIAQGKPADAKKRYEAVVARDAANFQARLGLADVLQRSGAKPAEVEAQLNEAVRLNPAESAPRLALIQFRLDQHQADAAVAAAQAAVAAIPGDPTLRDSLGRAQLAKGDTQQAIHTFQQIAATQSKSVAPYLRLAQIYLSFKDYPSAVSSLNRALEISPRLVTAQQSLAEIALARKRIPDALAVAHQVQQQRPNEAVGYLIESSIHVAQRAWEPAIASMRRALENEHKTDVAIRLHALYRKAGREAEAEKLAANWRQERPQDLDFLSYLASSELQNKNFAKSEALYGEMLKQQPDSVVAMNNIAWLLAAQGKPGAVAMAQRAVQLAPKQANLMDTMAMALRAEKQPKEALDWSRKAVAASPDDPHFRLTLARLLIDTGDRQQAKVELDKLVALGPARFDQQAEVSALLAGL